MSKNKIIVIVFVVVVAVAGYWLASLKTTPPVEDISQTINQGVLPSLGETANPLKNKPNVNPVDASNPFRSIKTNPFE